MTRVEQYTQAEARDFFERLATYSAEYVRETVPAVHGAWPSKNCYEEWAGGAPRGHVLHYTAGVNFAGTLRHFVLGHRAASNWVVAKALDQRFDDLRKQLELDGDLRAEVVQVVPPTQPAWHAGWVNRFMAGTEVRNAGILRAFPKDKVAPAVPYMSRDDFFQYGEAEPEELDFYWWADQWTSPFRGEVVKIHSPGGGATFWESWSRGSVATVITVLRYLNSLYPGKLDPALFVAHHQVNRHKNDVVLPLDLGALRDSVLFSRDHVDDLEWLAGLDDVEDTFQDEDDPWLLREMAERQGDRAEDDPDDDFHLDARDTVPELTAADKLQRLGYYMKTTEAAGRSVRLFQKSRGLTVDGIAGSQTNHALDKELAGWRLV